MGICKDNNPVVQVDDDVERENRGLETSFLRQIISSLRFLQDIYMECPMSTCCTHSADVASARVEGTWKSVTHRQDELYKEVKEWGHGTNPEAHYMEVKGEEDCAKEAGRSKWSECRRRIRLQGAFPKVGHDVRARQDHIRAFRNTS